MLHGSSIRVNLAKTGDHMLHGSSISANLAKTGDHMLHGSSISANLAKIGDHLLHVSGIRVNLAKTGDTSCDVRHWPLNCTVRTSLCCVAELQAGATSFLFHIHISARISWLPLK